MKIYICGSMQGQTDHGFEQFNEAERRLIKTFPDATIVNPAALDEPVNLKGDKWQQCLKRDIGHLITCDDVVLLEGWELSPGANLEKYIAELLGITTILLNDFIQTENSDIWKKMDRPRALDFNLLFRQITKWQEETFGKRTDPKPPLHHLEKEVKELLENPDDLLEYADCFILLFNAVNIAGFTSEQLLKGIAKKFEINKKRK
jgi:Protein of unknown function (DUF550)/Domain of unknown function (DUF4406)